MSYISQPSLELVVRPAELKDAQAIRRVHGSSVPGLAGRHYTPAQIRLWTAGLTLERIKQALARETATLIVAEFQGRVVGFALLEFAVVLAVYVAADQARQGVGRRLMRRLEEEARGQGAKKLSLQASLNSEDFYLALGFQKLREEVFPLGQGEAMPCLVMEKNL